MAQRKAIRVLMANFDVNPALGGYIMMLGGGSALRRAKGDTVN